MEPAAYRAMTDAMKNQFQRASPPPLPEEQTPRQPDDQPQPEGSWIYGRHMAGVYPFPERARPSDSEQHVEQAHPISSSRGIERSLGLPWMLPAHQQPLMWTGESTENENETWVKLIHILPY